MCLVLDICNSFHFDWHFNFVVLDLLCFLESLHGDTLIDKFANLKVQFEPATCNSNFR